MTLPADAAHPPLLHRGQTRDGAEQPEALIEAVGGDGCGGAHPGQERPGVRGVGDRGQPGEEPGEVPRRRRRLSPLTPHGRGRGPGQPVPCRDVGHRPRPVETHPQVGGGRVVRALDHHLQLPEVARPQGDLAGAGPVQDVLGQEELDHGGGRERALRGGAVVGVAGDADGARLGGPGRHPGERGGLAGHRHRQGSPARIGGGDRGDQICGRWALVGHPCGRARGGLVGGRRAEGARRPGRHEEEADQEDRQHSRRQPRTCPVHA